MPTGTGAFGQPNWLLKELPKYATSGKARNRVLTRLYRMSLVLKGRSRTLSIGRHLYRDMLAQNPGDFEEPDFPD